MAQPQLQSSGPIDRIQQNVLARNERRLLNWICARLPAWATPDMMTYFGLSGAFMVLGGYIGSNWNAAWLWLSIAGYIVHWFGDSTDGSLARFRGIERPRYGYFLDHSCDGLATLLVVVGIGLTPYVQLEVALVALAGYLLMSVHAFLSVRVLGELKLSYMAAGPTEMRLALIALTGSMLAFGTEPNLLGGMSPYDIFSLSVGLGLIGMFLVQTVVTARRLAAEEPARKRD